MKSRRKKLEAVFRESERFAAAFLERVKEDAIKHPHRKKITVEWNGSVQKTFRRMLLALWDALPAERR